MNKYDWVGLSKALAMASNELLEKKTLAKKKLKQKTQQKISKANRGCTPWNKNNRGYSYTDSKGLTKRDKIVRDIYIYILRRLSKSNNKAKWIQVLQGGE